MTPTFSPSTADDTTRLASQWFSVSHLAEEEFSRSLNQSVQDLDAIQKLLDDDIVDRSTYAQQCLGVALGRVMVRNNDGLDGWIVEDEFGRDLCVRYLETTLRLNPITMISKRIERGEVVNMRGLFQEAMYAETICGGG